MAIPPQTPDYQRRLDQKAGRLLWIVPFFGGGIIVITIGLGSSPMKLGVVWLGVGLVVLSVLINARWVIVAAARAKKERALREPGYVQLPTATTSVVGGGDDKRWKLTSDMQIRLDNGQMFKGSYHSFKGYLSFKGEGVKLFDAWFRVGARLRCQVNPTNSDTVWVFPFAAPGDALPPPSLRAELNADSVGREIVRFNSAT
jgi:hypothetical protein